LTFRKRFFRNILILGSYDYSSEIISFLSSVVLARLLLPEEYGIVAMVMVFSNFVVIFSGSGIGSDIIRSNYRLTYHKGMLTLSLYIGLGLFVIMAALAYPIALFYDNMKLIGPTLVISSQFIIKGILNVHYSLLMKSMHFNYLGKVNFFSNLYSSALMILMAFLGFSYWSLIIPLIIAEVLKLLYLSAKTELPFRIYPMPYVIAAFRQARSIIGNIIGFSVINYWARNADNMIIGKVYGEGPLGLYNRGYRFLNLSLKLITRLFGGVMYPSMKELQDEGGDVRGEYINLLGIISLLNFPVGLVLILFPDAFVWILWGPNWMEVASYLPYFGLLIMLQTMISTTGKMYLLFHSERTLFLVGAISALIMIGAILLGAQISVISVARYYAFSYIVLIVPLQVIFGFIRSFGYSFQRMAAFWSPKLLLAIGLLFSIWNNYQGLTVILMTVYGLHLVIFQRKDIIRILQYLKQRIY